METTAVTSSDTAVSSATTDVNAAVESIQEQVDIASDLMSKMGDYIKKFLPLVVFALIIIFIGYIVTKLITKVIDRAMKRSKIDVGAKNFLLSVIRIGLYTVVLIMALSVLKVPISSIITILGAAGLAVSLALQTCLSNLAGGFIILFSKPFVTGDIIEFNSTVFCGMLESWGAKAVVYPIVKDKKDAIRAMLRQAVSDCDLVLVSAGSSAGRDDYTCEIAWI